MAFYYVENYVISRGMMLTLLSKHQYILVFVFLFKGILIAFSGTLKKLGSFYKLFEQTAQKVFFFEKRSRIF